jgi:hypothetical protein
MPVAINWTQEEENVDYCLDRWRRSYVRQINTHIDLASPGIWQKTTESIEVPN